MTKKTIQAALCSFGMSGQVFHAPFIEVHPGFKLYGVYERTKNLAQEKYPNVKTFRSLDEMLLDKNIDFVVVNTPNITHFEYTKKCIEAGKHVIVEKPFTVTAAEAKQLILLAEKHNVKLSVYHNRRWDSDFKTVQKIIENKILGKIVEAELRFDRYSPSLSTKAHKESPTEGVGGLYDLGSHIIDQTLYLFGMPISVSATLDNFRADSKVDDYFDLKLKYNSHYVTLKSSYFVLEPLPAFSVHGKNGSFIKSRADVQEATLQKNIQPNSSDWGIEPDSEKGLLHIIKDGNSVKKYIVSEKGDYSIFYEEMYHAIQNNAPLPVSAEEGMNVIKIIEAAVKSDAEKRVVFL
ncbi:MAG: Gfo/Idh/MocA family oxidoreductase [Patiriisocius sp.]|uniref:Gfo/Idh/MocA family oxidoreductase n=1 Tax=Patiriisocius sp. TaxID=2822396 RepID=UPI003EF812C8